MVRRPLIGLTLSAMTPKYRAKLLLDFGIGALLAACAVCAFIGGFRAIYLWTMIVATVGYFIVVALQVAISRCPRCRALVDLREGGSSCPKCGVWIPPAKGAPPSGG